MANKPFCLFIYVFLFCLKSSGQVRTITGQILDQKNNPISLATINLVGTNATAISDDLGSFLLKLPLISPKGEVITIQISKSGYRGVIRHLVVSYLSTPIHLTKITGYKFFEAKYISPHINPPKIDGKNINTGINNGIIGDNNTIIDKPIQLPSNEVISALDNIAKESNKIVLLYNSIDNEAVDYCKVLKKKLLERGYMDIEIGPFMDLINRRPIGIQYSRKDSVITFVITLKPID